MSETLLAFSDELQKTCRHCATISYIETSRLIRQPLPAPDDLTATVTFLSFRNETYPMTYETFADVARDLPRFIDAIYNTSRLHSALRYLSPQQFEDQHARQRGKTAA